MRPEEIAMLPPTERASVIQLVRLDVSYGLLFSPERDDPARVIGYSLALPRCRPHLLRLTRHLSRPTCIPELYKYPPASLQRPLWLSNPTWLEIPPDKGLSVSQQLRGSRLTLNNSVYASVHSRYV
jgi:hypothetical protein